MGGTIPSFSFPNTTHILGVAELREIMNTTVLTLLVVSVATGLVPQNAAQETDRQPAASVRSGSRVLVDVSLQGLCVAAGGGRFSVTP